MLTCARCGQSNQEGQQFCGNCGISLVSAASPTVARVVPNAGGAWVCSQCGGYVRIDAEKCKHCGIALIPAQPADTSKRGDVKVVLVILGLTTIAVVFGCIVVIGILTLLGQRVEDVIPTSMLPALADLV